MAYEKPDYTKVADPDLTSMDFASANLALWILAVAIGGALAAAGGCSLADKLDVSAVEQIGTLIQ